MGLMPPPLAAHGCMGPEDAPLPPSSAFVALFYPKNLLPPIHHKGRGFSPNLNSDHDTYYGSEGVVFFSQFIGHFSAQNNNTNEILLKIVSHFSFKLCKLEDKNISKEFRKVAASKTYQLSKGSLVMARGGRQSFSLCDQNQIMQ